MSVEAATFLFAPSAAAPRDDSFRWSERLVLVLGACAAGAIAGLGAAFAIGAVPLFGMLLFTAPFFGLALYCAGRNGLEAGAGMEFWPGVTAALSMAILAAWPFAFALISWGAPQLWFIPLAALVALTLFTVLWRPSARTVYRSAAQAALIACIAAHSGVVTYLGS
jgi:hypothetical protein